MLYHSFLFWCFCIQQEHSKIKKGLFGYHNRFPQLYGILLWCCETSFFVICLFVFFGWVIHYLNNTNRLSLKSFMDLHMTYLMLPFLFVMRMALSFIQPQYRQKNQGGTQ